VPSKPGDPGIELEAAETPFEPSDETRGVIVDAVLALAETQLLAQVADDASLDGRATGLIGFNGALLAAVIAAKELLELGPLWPSPIFVVFVATGMLLWVLYGGRRRRDQQDDGDPMSMPAGAFAGAVEEDDQGHAKPNRVGVSLGVRAGKFYETYAEGSPLKARELLLDELKIAFEKNFERIARKRRWLQRATLFLIVGLALAAFLIEVDRPTNMEKTWLEKTKTHPSPVLCRGQQGSNKSRQAAKPRKAIDTGELIEIAREIEGSVHGPLLEIAEAIECS
jgi:hypothetical protein